MINGWVLVCADCGNTDLEVNYIDHEYSQNGNGGAYSIFCPNCENMGRVQGFTAGPIRLRADKVREIQARRVRQNDGKNEQKTGQNDALKRAKRGNFEQKKHKPELNFYVTLQRLDTGKRQE